MASQPGSIFGSSTATQGQTNVAYFVPAQTGVTFNWTYNGSGVVVVSGQGTEGVTINYTSTATSGDIEVRASSTLCPSTSLPTSMTVTVSPPTGIEDGQSNASYSLFVYPNPATSEAIVELNMKSLSHVNVTVYDILGHEVKVLLDQNLTSITQAFSLDGLAYGVYFIKAKSGDEVVTVKLIKH